MGLRDRFVRSHSILGGAPLLAEAADGLSLHTGDRVCINFIRVALESRVLKHHRYFIGWLCVGINSSILSYFTVAFLSQWWLRTRYPRWFAQYNYIIGAGESRQRVCVSKLRIGTALDGGTQVMVFILSFAVQGAAGTSHLFPNWWGADQNGNYDHCAYLT